MSPHRPAQHVVVGAGSVGSRLARLLAERGDGVRLVSRSGNGPVHPRIERVAADAADAARLAGLARGAVALYNCVNPPYHRWAQVWPPLSAAFLAAAEESGAVLVAVSNLYLYGPVDGPMTEATPLAARYVKGQVRARMWEEALAAHRAGRVRYTEVRGSDYLGATEFSQLGDRVVPRLLAGRPVMVLGEPDAPHTWTHTGDVARTLAVVGTDERAWGRAWHVPSNPARTWRETVDDLCRAAGVPPVRVTRMPGWMLRVGGVFSPFVREVPDVLYQHVRPFVMDSSAARTELGIAPTPWDDVLRAHLEPYLATAPGAGRDRVK